VRGKAALQGYALSGY